LGRFSGLGKEHPQGCWVKTDDFDRILAERDALQQRLNELDEQHQGEPVAWLTKCKHSGLVEQAEPNEKASNPAHWTDAFPVYTHADPAEVEGLCAELAALRELKLPHYLKLSDEMRAAGDYAEQRAREDQCYSAPVLKAVFFEAAIQRWLDDQEEALSASAEPSAPVEPLYPKCTVLKDANVRYSSSTAPVERDERTAFDPLEWLETEITAVDTWYRGSPSYEHDAGWMKDQALRLAAEARAALARKP
jgi:hypothetical protein